MIDDLLKQIDANPNELGIVYYEGSKIFLECSRGRLELGKRTPWGIRFAKLGKNVYDAGDSYGIYDTLKNECIIKKEGELQDFYSEGNNLLCVYYDYMSTEYSVDDENNEQKDEIYKQVIYKADIKNKSIVNIGIMQKYHSTPPSEPVYLNCAELKDAFKKILASGRRLCFETIAKDYTTKFTTNYDRENAEKKIPENKRMYAYERDRRYLAQLTEKEINLIKAWLPENNNYVLDKEKRKLTLPDPCDSMSYHVLSRLEEEFDLEVDYILNEDS